MVFQDETTFILFSVSPNNKFVMVYPKNSEGSIHVIPKKEFDSNYQLIEGMEYKKRVQ